MRSATPPHFPCGKHATPARGKEKLSAKTLLLYSAIYRQTRQTKTRNVMTRQPAPHQLWGTRIFDGGGAERIEAENRLLVGFGNRQKRLRAAELVTLTGISLQEFVQRGFSAVECLPVMCLADRLFAPDRHARRRGSAFAAANSLAFGAGGCSSSSKTRRLSRSDSRRCSASSITALAARNA
jgi:hypothetical protein